MKRVFGCGKRCLRVCSPAWASTCCSASRPRPLDRGWSNSYNQTSKLRTSGCEKRSAARVTGFHLEWKFHRKVNRESRMRRLPKGSRWFLWLAIASSHPNPAAVSSTTHSGPDQELAAHHRRHRSRRSEFQRALVHPEQSCGKSNDTRTTRARLSRNPDQGRI